MEKSPTITCTDVVVELELKLASPPYVALTVCCPVVANDSEHPPAATAALHDSPVFAVTVTVPVGAGTLATPVTLTAIDTGCPKGAGFGDAEVIVVVVPALFTTSCTDALFDA